MVLKFVELELMISKELTQNLTSSATHLRIYNIFFLIVWSEVTWPIIFLFSFIVLFKIEMLLKIFCQ